MSMTETIGPALDLGYVRSQFPSLAETVNGHAAAFLDGVNASAVALMAFVGYQFARAALTNFLLIAVAIVSAFLVFRYKVNSTWLVLGGAILGILLHTFGKI